MQEKAKEYAAEWKAEIYELKREGATWPQITSYVKSTKPNAEPRAVLEALRMLKADFVNTYQFLEDETTQGAHELESEDLDRFVSDELLRERGQTTPAHGAAAVWRLALRLCVSCELKGKAGCLGVSDLAKLKACISIIDDMSKSNFGGKNKPIIN